MFSTPSFRVFNHQAQENKDALMARKPGVLNSARKPLADRSVNDSKLLKPQGAIPKVLNKVNLSTKKASPKEVDYPDWLMDTCSFKEVEDTYEDIFPKSQRLNQDDIINMIQPKTPPLKTHVEIDPMFLELPQENFYTFQDHEEIGLEKIPIDDVELPDFKSLTGISF